MSIFHNILVILLLKYISVWFYYITDNLLLIIILQVINIFLFTLDYGRQLEYNNNIYLNITEAVTALCLLHCLNLAGADGAPICVVSSRQVL